MDRYRLAAQVYPGSGAPRHRHDHVGQRPRTERCVHATLVPGGGPATPWPASQGASTTSSTSGRRGECHPTQGPAPRFATRARPTGRRRARRTREYRVSRRRDFDGCRAGPPECGRPARDPLRSDRSASRDTMRRRGDRTRPAEWNGGGGLPVVCGSSPEHLNRGENHCV